MREESNRIHDVFLSYSTKDKTWADAACAVLERHRVRCWIAPRDITPGDEWGAAIIRGLNGSRIMVLIFSGHANASGQVRREVERAISQGMTVLPVRVEDVRPEGAMEYALGNRHWLDAFTPPMERQLEKLARSVQTLLANDAESPAAPAPAEPAAAAPAKSPDVASMRRPSWVWPSVVVGVLMLGFLAAWLGGVFKVKTPDGMIVQEKVPSKTSRAAELSGIGGLPTSAVESPARTLVGNSPAGLGMESVPAGEDGDVEELTQLQLEQMRMNAAPRHPKPVERGQHPKHHGVLVARFTVLENLPAELRVGVFREPKTYTSVIRFSNAGEQDDRVPDNHGMAIKLLGVKPTKLSEKQKDAETQSQDFVLSDHPLFFTPNVASLLAFSTKKKYLMLGKGLTGKDLLEAFIESFPNEVGLLEGRKKHIKSPLAAQYFSTTPYKFGETAVKYSAKPEQSKDYLYSGELEPSKDYLREVLVEQLRLFEQPAGARATRQPAARFGFYVQRQIDPAAMPIEDPTVEWKSVWEKVATIEIDAQDFDFSARWEWGNRLSFSPWHALDEHRPLGGINRARRVVYAASFDLRIQNSNPPKEATEAEIPMK
jgi:TIR domain